MKPRLNPWKAVPDAMRAIPGLENQLKENGFDPVLLDLWS